MTDLHTPITEGWTCPECREVLGPFEGNGEARIGAKAHLREHLHSLSRQHQEARENFRRHEGWPQRQETDAIDIKHLNDRCGEVIEAIETLGEVAR